MTPIRFGFVRRWLQPELRQLKHTLQCSEEQIYMFWPMYVCIGWWNWFSMQKLSQGMWIWGMQANDYQLTIRWKCINVILAVTWRKWGYLPFRGECQLWCFWILCKNNSLVWCVSMKQSFCCHNGSFFHWPPREKYVTAQLLDPIALVFQRSSHFVRQL